VSSTSHLIVPTGHTGQRVALAPDPFINNLVLALPFNSESVFDDVSPKGNHAADAGIGTTTASLPFGVSGVTTTSSGIVTFSKYYGSSVYFDGTTGRYIKVPSNVIDSFVGDYTIEMWVYPISTSDSILFSATTNTLSNFGEYTLSFYSGNLRVNTRNGDSADFNLLTSSSSISTYQWTHIAVTKFSGTTRVFINGTLDNTTSTSIPNITFTPTGIAIGRYFNTQYPSSSLYNGYLQDLRIYKGVAKYTSNFTPPNQIAI